MDAFASAAEADDKGLAILVSMDWPRGVGVIDVAGNLEAKNCCISSLSQCVVLSWPLNSTEIVFFLPKLNHGISRADVPKQIL